MGRYRKILVAVDGSNSSRNAFRQACRIARSDESWITAVTAIPLFQDQFDVISTKEKVSSALTREGENILSDIKKIAGEEDVFVKVKLEEGSPADTIIEIADENNFDLIVIGRHGKSRIERVLMGSVTARVIGHTPKDVLVVPDNAEIGWQKILLTTDGSKYNKAAAERAIDIAKGYGSEFKIVSVVDVPPEFYAEAANAVDDMVNKAKGYVDDVKKKAETEGVKTEVFVREGESYRIIIDLAVEQGVEIIVMGSHGRTGLERLLMGSVTEKVIGYASCPVLVVKT
jgi:nucleotide-binding universal stress UspA family protein